MIFCLNLHFSLPAAVANSFAAVFLMFVQSSDVAAQSASQEYAITQIRGSFERARIRYIPAHDDIIFAGWINLSGDPQLGVVRLGAIHEATLHGKASSWLKTNASRPTTGRRFPSLYSNSELDNNGKERILEPLLDSIATLTNARDYYLWTNNESQVPFRGIVLGIESGGKNGQVTRVTSDKYATVVTSLPFANDSTIADKLSVSAELLDSGATHIRFGKRGVVAVKPSQTIELRLKPEFQKFRDLVRAIRPSRVAANGALVFSTSSSGLPVSSDLQTGSVSLSQLAELFVNGLPEVTLDEPLRQDPLLWLLQ